MPRCHPDRRHIIPIQFCQYFLITTGNNHRNVFKGKCICAGIQRKGEALAATVNRAKPSTKERLDVFEDSTALSKSGMIFTVGLPANISTDITHCFRLHVEMPKP